jgi:hypothetical protein
MVLASAGPFFMSSFTGFLPPVAFCTFSWHCRTCIADPIGSAAQFDKEKQVRRAVYVLKQNAKKKARRMQAPYRALPGAKS